MLMEFAEMNSLNYFARVCHMWSIGPVAKPLQRTKSWWTALWLRRCYTCSLTDNFSGLLNYINYYYCSADFKHKFDYFLHWSTNFSEYSADKIGYLRVHLVASGRWYCIRTDSWNSPAGEYLNFYSCYWNSFQALEYFPLAPRFAEHSELESFLSLYFKFKNPARGRAFFNLAPLKINNKC